MRVHRLEIQAFGPFAGQEVIDFDHLSAHGLFLLNGPTGAGKTSILDAICFALYGSVPGARQDGKRLRSDHATPATEPQVVCEFSARGRRFEVSRSPAWDRPSARGTNGFTTQKAKTLLRERVNGEWLEMSGRNDEAGGQITALLGMDREQFTRVVMLPQGDFAAFLRAKAADRLELLQKLFGTQRFEAIEQQLAREAAEAREDVAGHESRLKVLVSRAEAEFAALDITDGGPSGGATTNTLSGSGQTTTSELLQAFHDAAALEAQRRRSAAETAASDAQRLTSRLQSEQEKAARHLKLAAANERMALLTARADAVAGLRIRLERHRQAEVLGGQFASVDAAVTRKEKAAERLATATVALPAGTPAAEAAQRLKEVSETVAVLEARIPDEETLEDLASKIATLEETNVANTYRRDKAVVSLESLKQDEEKLAAEADSLQRAAARLPEAERFAAETQKLIEAIVLYNKARHLEELADSRHLDAKEHCQVLRQRWLDLREERLNNAAADLAALLEDGAPCPVCGSAEHPAPAAAAQAALAIAQEEKRAHEALELANRELERLAAELSEARQAVALLAGKGGMADSEEAAVAGSKAAADVSAARSATEQLTQNQSERARISDELAAVSARVTQLEAELIHGASKLSALIEQFEALDSQLAGLRSGYPSLRHRIRVLHEDRALLSEAVRAAEDLERTSGALAESEAALLKALPAAGFASAREARKVLLSEAEAAAIEHDIASHGAESARLDELFSSEDIVLAGKELKTGERALDGVELTELRQAASAMEEETRRLFVSTALAEKATSRLGEILDSYVVVSAEGRKPRERAGMLTSLAETARGGGENSYRMSLNSYVLAARLEQVAVAASERLVAMSDGRYTLQHSDAKAARGARSGLGLQVLDGWTGQLRDTATLSGGESFMASLALALGLADVVQHESGGIDIETLFVDEGFGSLDEQALEQVMDALEGLRDGGRVVGLVSHVGEMKQRISTQLQVIKGRHGSTVQVSENVPA